MVSPTSVTTENPEPRGRGEGGACSKGIPAATGNNIDVAYFDERSSRGPWLSEVPPTGVLTGVLGEMSFYYGACWIHHRRS
jgi:hypothetical protein